MCRCACVHCRPAHSRFGKGGLEPPKPPPLNPPLIPITYIPYRTILHSSTVSVWLAQAQAHPKYIKQDVTIDRRGKCKERLAGHDRNEHFSPEIFHLHSLSRIRIVKISSPSITVTASGLRFVRLAKKLSLPS